MTALQTATKQLAKEQAKAKREALELHMLRDIKAVKLDAGLARQHRFHPVRMWSFDFAWPARKWAMEVEGGTWSGGRHTSGTGYRDDCEKYAAAALAGWRVLRATSDQVTGGIAIQWLEEALLPKAMPSLLAGLDDVMPDKRATKRPKEVIVRSEPYRRLVAARPCIHCRIELCSQAAHENHGKGKSMKVTDLKLFPLCTVRGADCHGRFDTYSLFSSRAEHIAAGKRWSRETAEAIRAEGNWPDSIEYPY